MDSCEALVCIIKSVQAVFEVTKIPLRVCVVRTDETHVGEELVKEYGAPANCGGGSQLENNSRYATALEVYVDFLHYGNDNDVDDSILKALPFSRWLNERLNPAERDSA